MNETAKSKFGITAGTPRINHFKEKVPNTNSVASSNSYDSTSNKSADVPPTINIRQGISSKSKTRDLEVMTPMSRAAQPPTRRGKIFSQHEESCFRLLCNFI